MLHKTIAVYFLTLLLKVPNSIVFLIYLCYYTSTIKNERYFWYFRGRTMQTIGYCRISTTKQNIERQVRNILAVYPNAKIVKENIYRNKISRQKRTE